MLESELGSEVENGRLVRLMTKMGFINERAEYVRFPSSAIVRVRDRCGGTDVECRFELDPRWSDTGDRYVLILR